MVKLSGPAMSLDASGKLANAIVFSKWKGRNYARTWVKPSNPKSAGQQGVRAMFKFLSQIWDGLTSVNKATWEDRADQKVVSTFNAFMSYNQLRWRSFKGPSKEDPAVDTTSTGTLGTLAATAGVRQVTVTQPTTVAGNLWGYVIYRGTSTGFDIVWSAAIAVVPVDGTNDVVYIDTPLDPGTYYYVVQSLTDDGAKGAETDEVNAAAS